MDLILLIVAASLYGIAISFGILREMDDHQVTRPLVVAGGVLLVLAVGTWGDWVEFGRWFLLFGAAGVPMLLRSAVLFVLEQRTRRLARHYPGDFPEVAYAETQGMADPR